MSAAPSDMDEFDRIDAEASEWLVRIEDRGLDRDESTNDVRLSQNPPG